MALALSSMAVPMATTSAEAQSTSAYTMYIHNHSSSSIVVFDTQWESSRQRASIGGQIIPPDNYNQTFTVRTATCQRFWVYVELRNGTVFNPLLVNPCLRGAEVVDVWDNAVQLAAR